jgi:hypothetical protein
MARDNPRTASFGAQARGWIAQAASSAGQGALLADGSIPVSAGSEEKELALSLLQCAVQADETPQAVQLLRKVLAPVVRKDERVARHAVNLAGDAVGGDWEGIEQALRGSGLSTGNAWGFYELLRHAVPPSETALPPRPTATTFPSDKMPLHYCVSGEERTLLRDDGQAEAAIAPAPGYDSGGLAALVGRQVAAFRAILEEPWFAERLALLDRTRRQHAPEAADPIQVISTGRAGTTALHDFLRRGAYQPYHTFVWQMAPRHRWETLNRLLTDQQEPDGLRRIARRYLSARFSELIGAYRLGRTPVIVSHFDVVFAPILMAAFEGICFLHLHRDPRAVATSMILKRQFAMSQLAALPYARPRPDAGARFALPSTDRLPALVAWYMIFTEDFYEALAAVAPTGGHAALAAEDLFEGRAAGHDALRRIFGNGIGSAEAVRAHFARKINEKQEKRFEDPVAEAYLEEALARYRDSQTTERRPAPAA